MDFFEAVEVRVVMSRCKHKELQNTTLRLKHSVIICVTISDLDKSIGRIDPSDRRSEFTGNPGYIGDRAVQGSLSIRIVAENVGGE